MSKRLNDGFPRHFSNKPWKNAREEALRMGELTIRRNRGAAGARYQTLDKLERAAKSAESRPAGKMPGASVSETLRRLMSRIGQAESQTRESHRTLQTGEAVLAEVQDSLSRMAELVRKAGGGETDRAALQAELERLCEEIDRMTGGASVGGAKLFLDGDMEIEDGAELDAALGEEGADGVQNLPSWLLKGMAQSGLTPERLLSMLGLDGSAGGREILAALAGRSLEGDSAAGYLAALYLGAVIAGGGTVSEAVDAEEALEGLRQLLEKVAEGVPTDQAVELLTNGTFTSLSDLEAQFTDGAAPGLQSFLEELLSGSEPAAFLSGDSLLTLLAGVEGVGLELLMGLLEAAQSSGSGLEPGLESGAESGLGPSPDTGLAPNPEAAGEDGAANPAVLELENARVTGWELSGVSVSESTGELTVSVEAAIQGTDQEGPPVLLTGSETVTLRNARVPLLTAGAPAVRVFGAGENMLGEVVLRPGASLTLGGGLVRIGSLRGDETGILRLTGGAVVMTGSVNEDGEPLGTLNVPVVVDGPALLAARAVSVTSASGKPMAPFDIVWKTLLPGWSALTALSVDGRQGRVPLLSGEPARLWLEKGDPSHGSPIHTVILWGKDKANRPRTRYAYLRWNESAEVFEMAVMYPNPFTVTGGEEGRDWRYEEETQTLWILSDQVEAVTGGAGIDANHAPFSGALALEDGIGTVKLTLGGVACQVSSGGAFRLGRENGVTLFLRSGTDNRFESGAGWAGISLEEGASLEIDCPEVRDSSRNPAGTLTASGGAGGAGIGRRSGGGRDQTSRIVIRGGVVTASGGRGGGAGIGAGKYGAMGPVIILGGTVSATGGTGGGAGIGGALGAPVGDISIRGGTVTAFAVSHAAAIGAGVRGNCGDILITGSARIRQALGGDPGADIGSCLFGGCGEVRISGGADIGKARLRSPSGVPLQMGEETIMLPQFRLSSRALGLDRLSVAKKEAVQAAQAVIERDRRWVAQIQAAYDMLYRRLERSFNGLLGVQRYLDGAEGPVRDNAAAGTLLEDMRRSIPLSSSQAARAHGKRGTEDVRNLLR